MTTASTDFGSTNDQQNTMRQEHESISIPSASDAINQKYDSTASTSENWLIPPPQSSSQSRPCTSLINGRREDYIGICVPLYNASFTGDWKAAKLILKRSPEFVRCAITESLDTPLHVAVTTKSTEQKINFVLNLLDLMHEKDLELQNKYHNTALCLAAATGNFEVARIMVEKNPDLLNIPGEKGMIPLCFSVSSGKRDMVEYLYANSRRMAGHFLTPHGQTGVLVKLGIEAGMFDFALRIVMEFGMDWSNDTCHSILYTLAQKPDAFNRRKHKPFWRTVNSVFSVINRNSVGIDDKASDALTLLRIIWEDIIRLPKDRIDEILKGPATQDTDESRYTTYSNSHTKPYSSRILFVAAEVGNTEFVAEILRLYHDLIWKTNDENLSIIHIAVKHRHEGIYNLIHEIGSMKDLIIPLTDKNGNNMLHLIGQKSDENQNLEGETPVLMLQDYQWFREVEMMLPPVYREMKNKDGQTPYQIFSSNNNASWYQSLLWADYGLVAATLVLGISFAATFTVPGGFNQNTGTPIFVHASLFSVFAIADAITLLASSISVMAFLSIVVFGRGLREQMLNSLPSTMILGLLALLISIMAMLVTFGASLFILYIPYNSLKWMLAFVFACASLMIIKFGSGQYPLLVKMFRSIHATRNLFKHNTSKFYNRSLKL